MNFPVWVIVAVGAVGGAVVTLLLTVSGSGLTVVAVCTVVIAITSVATLIRTAYERRSTSCREKDDA
jgi:hypothetical protein